jgi:hypothetical protein
LLAFSKLQSNVTAFVEACLLSMLILFMLTLSVPILGEMLLDLGGQLAGIYAVAKAKLSSYYADPK